MNERRRFKRIPEHLGISYKVLPASGVKRSITKDISTIGICFLAHEFIVQGAFLEVKLSMGRQMYAFDAVAQVAWIREQPFSGKYEVGIQFVEISPDDAQRLNEYIIDILKESSAPID